MAQRAVGLPTVMNGARPATRQGVPVWAISRAGSEAHAGTCDENGAAVVTAALVARGMGAERSLSAPLRTVNLT